MIGNGLLLTRHAQLIIVGTSAAIASVDFEIINKVNFPALTFLPQTDGLLDFDETTGLFELLDSGILQMDATLNVKASVASAEFQLIPEFNIGGTWGRGVPRKKVLTAIKPDQVPFHGSKFFEKGTQLRFWVKSVSGDVLFQTETLDPGGPLEAVLPAAIFYLELDRITARL